MRLPLTQGLKRSFETQPTYINSSFLGGFVHQHAHAVVGDKVHDDFLVHHLRGFALENIHSHRGFDVSEEQFYIPALEVEIGEFIGGVGLCVSKGGNDVK